MITVALGALAAWLTALTLVTLGLAKQLAVVQLASSAGAPANFSLDADGLDVGSRVPTDVAVAISSAFGPVWEAGGVFLAVIISGTCPPCERLAHEVGALEQLPSNVVFVLPGREVAAERIREALGPRAATIVDPVAHTLMKGLEVNSTPFGVRVVAGVVRDKGYLRSLDDFLRLSLGPVSEPELEVVQS